MKDDWERALREWAWSLLPKDMRKTIREDGYGIELLIVLMIATAIIMFALCLMVGLIEDRGISGR